MLTIGRIDRTGEVHQGDASISVWEEGICVARAAGGYEGAQRWERQFKRDVFARIVQTLRRIGWTVGPWDETEHYKAIALNHRSCSKGELKGELALCGRHIEFKMWQGVNTPTRPDHGGKYEWNKEACAPYLLRLEMQRTRNRIREYLCNVFTGYTCAQPRDCGQRLDARSDKELSSWRRADADGNTLSHGAVRWCRDRKGRLIRGRVYGGINGMWTLVYGPGRGDQTTHSARQYFGYQPGMPRRSVDPGVRAKRLKAELEKAIKAENFERAVVLRDVIRADAKAQGVSHG